MGHQQLLLIALGVIVVGIAVVVGMDQFSTSAAEANRDALILDLNFISNLARTHYNRPTDIGGGGNSFENFEIPEALVETVNGTIQKKKIGHNKNEIRLIGIGKEIGKNGRTSIKIEFRVTKNEIKVRIKN